MAWTHTTLNIVFSAPPPQFHLSCSTLIISRLCGVTNTKCKLSIVCHSLQTIWELLIYDVAITITYYVKSIIHDNILEHKCSDIEYTNQK